MKLLNYHTNNSFPTCCVEQFMCEELVILSTFLFSFESMKTKRIKLVFLLNIELYWNYMSLLELLCNYSRDFQQWARNVVPCICYAAYQVIAFCFCNRRDAQLWMGVQMHKQLWIRSLKRISRNWKCVSLSNSQAGVLTQIRSGYRWSDWGIKSLGTLQKIRVAWSQAVRNIRTLDSLGQGMAFCQTEQDHFISASKAAIKPPWVEEAGSGACALTMQFLVLASLCHRCKDAM